MCGTVYDLGLMYYGISIAFPLFTIKLQTCLLDCKRQICTN